MQETNNAIANPAAPSPAEECRPAPASLWRAEGRDPAVLPSAEKRDPARAALWYWAEDRDPAAQS